MVDGVTEPEVHKCEAIIGCGPMRVAKTLGPTLGVLALTMTANLSPNVAPTPTNINGSIELGKPMTNVWPSSGC